MRVGSGAGIVGSAVAAGAAVLYLVLIRSQGDDGVTSTTAWALTFAIGAILGVAASYIRSSRAQSLLFAALAGTMLGVGLLAIFSIGMLLIVAGSLFALAAFRAAPGDRWRDLALPWMVGSIACIAIPGALYASSAHASTTAWPPSQCQVVGRDHATTYALCFQPNRNAHGTVLARHGGSVRTLDVRPPGPTPSAAGAGRAGHWAWAALSPDGRLFVAEWSGECEVPNGFFVRAHSAPRPVTGEADWAKSPESTVMGWTTDGRAIVRVAKSSCGFGGAPGLYVISPSGARTRIGGLDLHPKRSLEPRPVAALLG
jgi:hypothetical protein